MYDTPIHIGLSEINPVLTATPPPYSVAVPVSAGGRLHSAPTPINRPATPPEIY